MQISFTGQLGPGSRNRRGFSLVELIAVVVVLGVLAAVAVPRFFDYSTKAKESSVKATLAATRSAIANFYADSAASGAAAYPTLVQLETLGTVLQERVPANPFVTGASASDVRAAVYNATTPPVSGSEGWNYEAATGRFWANSDTSGINENEW